MGGGLSRMEGGARAARAGAVTKHSLRDAATAPDAGGCGGRVLGEARRGFLGRRDGAGGVAADLSAGETGWCKKGCCYDDDDLGGGTSPTLSLHGRKVGPELHAHTSRPHRRAGYVATPLRQGGVHALRARAHNPVHTPSTHTCIRSCLCHANEPAEVISVMSMSTPPRSSPISTTAPRTACVGLVVGCLSMCAIQSRPSASLSFYFHAVRLADKKVGWPTALSHTPAGSHRRPSSRALQERSRALVVRSASAAVSLRAPMPTGNRLTSRTSPVPAA